MTHTAHQKQISQSLWKRFFLSQQPPVSFLLCLLLFAIVATAYYPAIQNGFVNYDDNDYVTENKFVQNGLSSDGIAWAFRSTAASNWHPLTWISHMTDCQLFGLNPVGHHLTSVIFHATNTVLLFLLLRGMTASAWASFVVALLFGIHPLRVESVAWVAERKDVLSTFFWLLTISAYVKYTRTTKHQTPKAKVWYACTLTFLALGLLSKPMLVTTPFLLLLLDCWPLNRWLPKKTSALVLEKIPMLALAIATSVITYSVQQSAGAVSQTLPLMARIQNAIVSYCRYLGKTFWPDDLCVCYPHPDFWPLYAVILCALTLITVTAFVTTQLRQRPYLFVGWFWYLGTLVPVIGIVQVGQQAMADRYTYFPTIGILLIVVFGIREFAMKQSLKCYPALFTISTAIVLVFVILTHQQISHWKNSECLFRRGIDVTKNNSLAHGGLARALVDLGKIDQAIMHYREALRLRPYDTIALNGLGNLLAQKGLFDEALGHFQAALKLKPYDPTALNNVGISLARKGQIDEAIGYLEQATQLKPDYVEAHNNLGGVLGAKGRFDEAINHFELSLKFNPNNAEGHNNLGLALIQKRRLSEAILHFQEAVRLKPSYAKAQKNLSMALAIQQSAPATKN